MDLANTLLLKIEKHAAEALICRLVSWGMDTELAGDHLAIIGEADKEGDVDKIKKTVETIGLNWPKFIKPKEQTT